MEEVSDAQIVMCSRDSLMEFCIIQDPNYLLNWHLEVIAKELEAIENRISNGYMKQYILLLEVPPRHGKSQLASINFPAYFLGKNPEKNIITASYSAELAQSMGMKTRDLVESKNYKFAFKTRLREDTKAKGKWLTEEGGGYMSVGVGGPLTGFGADCLIIDDPVKSREEADSQVIRDKIWDWFRSTAWTRLEPGACTIVIMQRWHKQDLIGRIKEEWKDRDDIDIKIIRFAAVCDVDDEPYRKKGEALWPDRYNLKALNSIRKTVGESNWASQFQQVPILQEHQEFKQEYFKYFNKAPDNLVRTIAVDLATGDKEVKNGDDIAITVVGKDPSKPEWYIEAVEGGLWDPKRTIDKLFELNREFKPRVIIIESNAYQKTFKFWLQEEMKRRQEYLPLKLINNSTKKEQRIRGLVPLYQAGIIYHRRGYLKLESELLNFPMGQHDDYCFVKGTKVSTPTGSKNIEQLVSGDFVLTPFGKTKVLGTKSRIAPVKNYGEWVCTPDHPFFSKKTKGFVDIDTHSMHNDFERISFKSLFIWRLRSLLLSMELNTNLWGRKSITYHSLQQTRGEKTQKGCTSLFGSILIKKQFRRAGLCTIKTIILLITTLATWSVWRGGLIKQCICENYGKTHHSIERRGLSTLKRLENKQRRGTHQKRGESGIARTGKTVGRKKKERIEKLLKRVSSAGRSLWLYLRELSIAALGALKDTSKRGILLRKSVKYVGSATKHIAKGQGEHVAINVERVYALKTECGTYYANGALVSNCDSLAFNLQAINNTQEDDKIAQAEARKYIATHEKTDQELKEDSFREFKNWGVEEDNADAEIQKYIKLN